MKTILYILLQTLFLLTAQSDESHLTNENVIQLTDQTFEHQTQASTGQTTGKWFVMFYAQWCGHCKKLMPIWNDLANGIDPEDDGNIIIAAVDTDKNPGLASRFSIRGFPTLLYFADRKMYRYTLERSIKSFLEFATTKYRYVSKMHILHYTHTHTHTHTLKI